MSDREISAGDPCPNCRTPLLKAPAIGIFCPSRECPVGDGPAIWPARLTVVRPGSPAAAAHNREIAAGEQMRDRIANFVLQEITRRDGQGSTAAKVQRALIPIERTIRNMPGRIAR